MSYIKTSDYKGRITTDLLNLATEEDPDILAWCDKSATDIIAGYTGSLYDVAAEFAKIGLLRNYQVLSWALSIALYHLYMRLPDMDIPDKIKTDYDECMADLEKISQGKLTVNLPPLASVVDPGTGTTPVQGEGLRRISTVAPRTHRI